MRSIVGTKLGIKAAGGIRSLAEALSMIQAGATRIGSSRSVEIMTEFNLSEQSEVKAS